MKKLLFMLLCGSSLAVAQKPVFTSAKVLAANVYSNAAELSQTATVSLPKGTSEIVIKNVADQLLENTIRIGAPSSVTVLSSQFTNNYIKEYELDENSREVKAIRDSIQLLEKQVQRTINLKDAEAKAIELLDANQKVTSTASGTAVELAKLMAYYRSERLKAANAFDDLDEKLKDQQKRLAELKNRLEIDSQKAEKISRGKLVLQVMNESAGNVLFEIAYLTPAAGWRPFYDLRVNSISAPIEVAYKGQVWQSTGIDWKQINLKLSSGNPSQSNTAPILNAWFLQYYMPMPSGFNDLSEVVVEGYNITRDKSKSNTLISGAPGAAASVRRYDSDGVSDFTSVTENQLNVSFDIDIPYDVVSNGKPHSVNLKQLKLPANYKFYAAPRADDDAFLLARIGDYSQYNLLPGEANIIFENMYVGKTTLNANQTSDSLNLSMGRDRKISVKREKLEDKSGTKFLSSKKEQTFTYEITVRNNKKEAVSLMLKDQYPLSTDKEMEIELKQSDGAKVNTETGILTWELELKPNETKKVRLSYKVRSPKDKVISNL
ncbi:MAG TPA: mucoidy inhibitor MuiA family protein [Flavobacterium sp.]|nr:mucoidy inhibitor MuiA family protein [Flavobacterium sp.]